MQDADFAPDGESLAVVHWVEDRCRLEFPIGRVLYEPSPPAWISAARVSPRGDRIAFLEHPVANDLRGWVSVVDLRGQKTRIGPEFATVVGLAWSGIDDLVHSGAAGVYAARIGGSERLIARPPESLTVLDVAPGGRSLLRREAFSAAVWGRGPASSHEQNLSDRDLSYVADISLDGQVVVGTWQDASAGPSDSVFLQRMEVSPPVRLGDGDALSLSRDGKWVLARLPPHPGERLVVVPTGAGETKELPAGDVQRYYEGKWFPDGRRVVFSGAREGTPPRLYLQDVDGGAPRPLGPEGYRLPRLGTSVSPDGHRVVAIDPEGTPVLYPLEGGDPVPIPGLLKDDTPIAWTADGKGLFYFDASEPAARVHRLDLQTGRPKLWRELLPSRPSGMFGDYRILITPDGDSYAYNYSSVRADLLLAEGLP